MQWPDYINEYKWCKMTNKFSWILSRLTLPKTNISPENRSSQKETFTSIPTFQPSGAMLAWGMVSVETLNHFPPVPSYFIPPICSPPTSVSTTWCNGNCWSNSKTSTEEVWASLYWNTYFFAKKGKLLGGWTNPSGKIWVKLDHFPK